MRAPWPWSSAETTVPTSALHGFPDGPQPQLSHNPNLGRAAWFVKEPGRSVRSAQTAIKESEAQLQALAKPVPPPGAAP